MGLSSACGSLKHTVSLRLGLNISPFSFVCERRRRLLFLPADSFIESRPALTSPKATCSIHFPRLSLAARGRHNMYPPRCPGWSTSLTPPTQGQRPARPPPAARTSRGTQTASPAQPQEEVPGGSAVPWLSVLGGPGCQGRQWRSSAGPLVPHTVVKLGCCVKGVHGLQRVKNLVGRF